MGDHADDATMINSHDLASIGIVVDRLVISDTLSDDESKLKRIRDSVALAFRVGFERLVLLDIDSKKREPFHSSASCIECGYSASDLTIKDFSFNSHHGACPECHGLGVKTDFVESMVVNPHLTLSE